MMQYKGFVGSLDYDDENRVFTGRVINTRTVITFHGSNVDELEREFHMSVDDYLAWCAEDGIEPERPFSGRFNVRFSPELHRRASIAAKALGISLNRFMEKAVEDELLQVRI